MDLRCRQAGQMELLSQDLEAGCVMCSRDHGGGAHPPSAQCQRRIRIGAPSAQKQALSGKLVVTFISKATAACSSATKHAAP